MTKIFVYGKYPHQNYIKAVKKAGFTVTMNPDEADCLLLGGGGDVAPCLYGGVGTNARDVDIERDVNELYLIRKFLKTDRYVFGICRGEQIINVYFGGTLYNTLSSRHAYRGRDRLHAATFKGLLKKTYGEAGIVNSAHRQAVQRLGCGLKATAIADDGEIEAIEGKNVFAVQFHPERTVLPAIDGEKLFSAFLSLAEKKAKIRKITSSN